MNDFNLLWLLVDASTGWSGDVARTVMLTLLTAFTGGSFGLIWSMRDDVRDSKRMLGDEEKKTGLIGKIGQLDDRVQRIEKRNLRIDAVYQQYAEDMARMPGDGGGQRASDRVLQQIIAGATATLHPDAER